MTLSITTFYVEDHNAESHYAECHNVYIALLNVTMLSVIMLRVVMLNVVALIELVTFEVAKNVRAPTLLAKIRLGCKLMKLTNPLTNCTVELLYP